MPRDWSNDSVKKQSEKIMTKLQVRVYVLICSAHKNGLTSHKNLLVTIEHYYCYVWPVQRILLTFHCIQEKALTICLKGRLHCRCHPHNTCGQPICSSGNVIRKACVFLYQFFHVQPLWTFHLFSLDDNASWRISCACLVARSRKRYHHHLQNLNSWALAMQPERYP